MSVDARLLSGSRCYFFKENQFVGLSTGGTGSELSTLATGAYLELGVVRRISCLIWRGRTFLMSRVRIAVGPRGYKL